LSDPLNADVIVLGAGMVGASTALHLLKRGRSVVLVDRRGAGEETSYGNTGIIQREGVVPYPFPRDIGLMAQYALNRRPEANLHWSALPRIAPWLYRYWQASTPAGLAASSRAARPLVERCIVEHEALMADAGILGMLRRTGYLRFHRSAAALAAELAEDQGNLQAYGVHYRALSPAELAEVEPHLRGPKVGGILMPEPVSVADPGAVVKAYARLFEERGGRFVEGDARTLSKLRDGWQVRTAKGPVTAGAVVVALGPWSDDLFRTLGLSFPFGVKRGYHMHFTAQGNATLNRPIIDVANGYALTPMVKGIRLTTGAEFALRDAPGQDGVWLNFGHHHLGFTLGPVTGRLLAELMTGEAPFTDPAPYRADRF
jgi:D-amino-acid dehydrogenase